MPGTNETQLEKTFSDLAYNHLRDKSNQLLDYLVGFQMLKQEDDGKRAVGIFGFQIDEDIYYAPVFFLNAEIRGLDSLYSETSDLFVPLTEDWVNNIINRRVTRLGTPNTQSRQERGVSVPNYSRLKIVPGGANINLKLAAMQKYRECETVDLISGLQQAGAVGIFKEALARDPVLRDSFEQFYNYADLVELRQVKKAEDSEKLVTVITSITDEGTDQLTDKQRKDLVGGGIAIIDKRPEGLKSSLYTTETKQRLEQPTGPGLYDVLWSDGSVEPAVICPTSDPLGSVFCYRTGDQAHCITSPQQINVVRKYGNAEFVKWLDDNADRPSDITPGEAVVFLNQVNGSAGFCVDKVLTGLDGGTVLHVNDLYYMDCKNKGLYTPSGWGHDTTAESLFGRGLYNHPQSISPGPTATATRGSAHRTDPNERVESIVIAKAGGPTLRYTTNKLLVNDQSVYVLKVNEFTLADTDPNWIGKKETYDRSKSKVILSSADFGDYHTIVDQLSKVASDLKVWSTDHLVTLADDHGVESFHKVAAIEHLMVVHGLNAQDAQLVVQDARHAPTTYKVKHAAQLLDLPYVNDRSEAGEMNMNFPQEVPVHGVNKAYTEDNRDFYRYRSPYSGSDEETVDGAKVMTDAAKSGDKDVFDASALGSLVKSHAPTELVDRFLPTISAGMDRLGRMLFLIYWHYDEFESRYGDRDLLEFLDTLKSTFDSLGDVVMFAKKRTLAGDPEHYGIGMMPMGDVNDE